MGRAVVLSTADGENKSDTACVSGAVRADTAFVGVRVALTAGRSPCYAGKYVITAVGYHFVSSVTRILKTISKREKMVHLSRSAT